MLFLKYTRELKVRYLYTLLSWLIYVPLLYIYGDEVIFLMYGLSTDFSCNTTPYLIFTNATEGFRTYLDNSLQISSMCICPLVLTQTFLFLRPGLYFYEQRKVITVLKIAGFFFLLSLLVSFNLLIPASWSFFTGFASNSGCLDLYFENRLVEFVSFLTNLLLGCALVFQVLALILIAVELNFVDHAHLIKYRRLVLFFSFLVGALITPPDVLSQIVVGLTTSVFFESLVFLIIFRKKFLSGKPVKAY